MKEWQNAEILEINFTDTNYGGTVLSDLDDLYINGEGVWEATFTTDKEPQFSGIGGGATMYYDENGALHVDTGTTEGSGLSAVFLRS